MKKLYLLTFFFLLIEAVTIAQIQDPKIEQTVKKNKSKIIVYTKTGDIYTGFFLSQNKDFLEITTEDGAKQQIATHRIKNIESLTDETSNVDAEKERLEHINPVRYMLGTSAFNYEKGVNYVRNNPMTIHRGISDNFSVGIGTSFWALVLGAPSIYINPQFTTQLGEYVHYKIGLDAFVGTLIDVRESAAAALLNTGLTVGEPDLNLTATVYYGAISDAERLNPFYSLGGMARISKKLMFVGEGFYVPTENQGEFNFLFYGGRYLTKTATYDLGFFYNQEVAEVIPFGIPFFAVTVKL